MRDAAGIDDGDPPEKARRRLTELLDGAGDDAERERTVERLALLLGLGEDRREESAFIDEVLQGFTALVDALAAEQPVTLMFEDVHTLRPPMLDLIERVAARRRDGACPAFVLAAARPQLLDERSGWGSRAANHLLLRLESLGNHEAVGLARQAGGARISEDEAAAVAARAGGNPFFIVESTGALIRVHERGEPASATPILPPTVQAMIAARLDALPATLRDVARRLSVYMYSFDLDEAALVAECGVEGMGELVDAEIVVRDERQLGPTHVALPQRHAPRRRVRQPAEATAGHPARADRRKPRGERPSGLGRRTSGGCGEGGAGHRSHRPARAGTRGRRAR